MYAGHEILYWIVARNTPEANRVARAREQAWRAAIDALCCDERIDPWRP